VIRKQVLQELMEEGGSISSLQEYYSNHNQRNGQFDLPDVTDDGNISKVTSFPFLHTSVPSSLNGMIPNCLENAKDVEQLEKHCRDLKSQLDLVKIEIVKIISEKQACSKENCALKNHISDLKNRLSVDEELKDVSCLQSSQDDSRLDKSQEVSSVLEGTSDAAKCTRTDCSDVALNESVSGKQPQVTLEVSSIKGIVVGAVKGDSDMPNLAEGSKGHTEELVTDKENDSNEKEKFDLPEKSSEHSSGIQSSASSLMLQVEDLPNILKREEDTHVKEITELKERCCELENSLELLRQVGLLNVFLTT